MRYKVLVFAEVEPYKAVLPQIEAHCDIHRWVPGESSMEEVLPQIEGLFTYGHHKVDGDFMDRIPKLKVISNFGVGVDHIDLAAAQERGIPVGNTPNVLDGATADMTFALMLAAGRNVVSGDRFARSAEFTFYDPSFMLGQEIHSATLGIVGMGNIGLAVARRALAFDMEVIYHNRNRRPEAEAELGVRYAPLDELLAQADFVALNMPLTAETRNMIGARELGLMKPTAVLVNAARGGVVDHDALVEALRQQRIFAAGLDVTEPEPLPRNHPLLSMDNVVVMPHLGSATHQTRQAMADRSVGNLLAGLRGEELLSRIV